MIDIFNGSEYGKFGLLCVFLFPEIHPSVTMINEESGVFLKAELTSESLKRGERGRKLYGSLSSSFLLLSLYMHSIT